MDERRYSYDAIEVEFMGVGARILLGNDLRIWVASVERMVARWGGLERSAFLTSLGVVLEKGGHNLGIFK